MLHKPTLRKTVRYVKKENKTLPFHDDNYRKNMTFVRPKRKFEVNERRFAGPAAK